jgi:DNA segregation ATPase FtsK/SpoIIIE, S-DNA-T family
LEELLAEVDRREGRLSELRAKKLTRRIAELHPDMRPIVSLYSECHELFGHKEYGELAAELAVKIIKRARKTGIVLAFDTQSSRAGAIPSELVELVSVNGCFYVKTWRSNDGFLGDGSFQSGIRATELRPGRDIGRSLITGVSDAQFELLKWHYIFSNDDTGEDDATPVIERCMKNLAPGTRVAGGDGASLPVITVRDLLGDLAELMKTRPRAKLAELAVLLKDMDKAHLPYRRLDGVQLGELLDTEGVKWVYPKNVPQLDRAELHKALAERDREIG